MYHSSWRQISLYNRENFFKWLISTKRRVSCLEIIATDLGEYLKQILNNPESCEDFLNAIPSIFAECNNDETYEKPYAVEAYAYAHLLVRYWRTWEMLLEIMSVGTLPLGRKGVRVLDVGTGPAPTPYAIYDFYKSLSDYGKENKIEELINQTVEFHIVEKSKAMCHFMHLFSEVSRRPGPFGANKTDFKNVDPVTSRKKLRTNMIDEDPDSRFGGYLPDELNDIVQSHERYKFVIFSNFLTLSEKVEEFTPQLDRLFSDFRFGSIAVILGGTGRNYTEIYGKLNNLAENANMKILTEIPSEIGTNLDKSSETIIKRSLINIYRHFEKILGIDNIENNNKSYDYLKSLEIKNIKSNFSLRVYRKGGWPSRNKLVCKQ
jgi:hypothetical protein